MQSPFIKQLVSRLKPGGYIHCATDWEDYAMQMMEVLSAEEALKNRFEGFARYFSQWRRASNQLGALR